MEILGCRITYTVLLKTDRIFTTDPKALNHVLSNSEIYQKPPVIRYLLRQVVGDGLLLSSQHVFAPN